MYFLGWESYHGPQNHLQKISTNFILLRNGLYDMFVKHPANSSHWYTLRGREFPPLCVSTGWWFVSTAEEQGWVPATYLHSHSATRDDSELGASKAGEGKSPQSLFPLPTHAQTQPHTDTTSALSPQSLICDKTEQTRPYFTNRRPTLTADAGAGVNTSACLPATISTLEQSVDSSLGKQQGGVPGETRPQPLK